MPAQKQSIWCGCHSTPFRGGASKIRCMKRRRPGGPGRQRPGLSVRAPVGLRQTPAPRSALARRISGRRSRLRPHGHSGRPRSGPLRRPTRSRRHPPPLPAPRHRKRRRRPGSARNLCPCPLRRRPGGNRARSHRPVATADDEVRARAPPRSPCRSVTRFGSRRGHRDWRDSQNRLTGGRKLRRTSARL